MLDQGMLFRYYCRIFSSEDVPKLNLFSITVLCKRQHGQVENCPWDVFHVWLNRQMSHLIT